jgi:PAS domain-containing protein
MNQNPKKEIPPTSKKSRKSFPSNIENVQIEITHKISETKFQKIFDQSSLGICVTDIDNRFVEVNDVLVKMWGYSRDELIGKPFALVTHAEDLQSNLILIQKVIKANFRPLILKKDM